MKNCLRIAIATVVAFGASASLSAEVVPLFDATPITDSGFGPDISQRFEYDQNSVTVYCAGPGSANVQTVGGGSPIVDNYITAGDDLQSICTGGAPNLGGGPVSGTNCFSTGNSSSAYWGDPIESVFTSNATAAIDLVDGENIRTIKLWDWGGVYGNTALELALPENCTATPPTIVSMCAGQHMDIGEINVTNDADNFYVSFEILEPGWYLTETHVAIGDIPTNKKGNPVPGQFPYACELDGSLEANCVVEIPRGDLVGDVNIAAHAAVFQLAGDGCGEDIQFASEVIDSNQGLRKDGGLVAENRDDPESVFAPGGEFFSLGFSEDLTVPGGDLTVGFGYPVYNAPGIDLCVQEITGGRPTYPEEFVKLYSDTELLIATVSNRANGTGYACVDLPGPVQTTDFVKLEDNTNPAIHIANADGYDVDFVAACYLYLGEETAWGAACYEDEGTRFVDQGNWGTFFSYTIH